MTTITSKQKIMRCREAMTFYKDCFGRELSLMTVGESPMTDQFPPDEKQHILHAALTNGSIVLMATDMAREAPVQGNAVALSLNCSRRHSDLSFRPAILGAIFGSLTDQFGMDWMLNYDKNTKE